MSLNNTYTRIMQLKDLGFKLDGDKKFYTYEIINGHVIVSGHDVLNLEPDAWNEKLEDIKTQVYKLNNPSDV